MTDEFLRPDLPPAPPRILALPRARGYPVPWFVAWIDTTTDTPRVAEPGAENAVAEFRVTRPGASFRAYRGDLCWVCGQAIPALEERAFVIGPMCAVNHNTAEPPCHVECAEWSAIACPFLARPHASRRESGMPDGTEEPAGIALMRNPGVALVWIVERYWIRLLDPTTGQTLFDIGDPLRVGWYAQGREATRDEVMASITSGLPFLRDLAENQGPAAVDHLDGLITNALTLVPA